MPHCTLEYTANLEPRPDDRAVLRAVHAHLVGLGMFRTEDIKSRSVRLDRWMTGDDDVESGFVSLEVAILDGRTDEVRAELAEGLLAVLRGHWDPAFAGRPGTISVRISEIHRASYRKTVRTTG